MQRACSSIIDAISTFNSTSCAVQMCSMGVQCRQATAMLSNEAAQPAWLGLLVPYRPLANFRAFGGAGA